MDGQSRLFGHALWTFQTEADLLLSTLVGLTSIRSGHDRRNDFKSTSVPCSGGSESSTVGTFILFCFTPVLRNESSRERKFHSWNFRFVLFHSCSKEWKFQGAKVPRNESSRERKCQGAKVPRSESYRERKFHIWNFRSRERMILGAKSPVTLHNLSVLAMHRQCKSIADQQK